MKMIETQEEEKILEQIEAWKFISLDIDEKKSMMRELGLAAQNTRKKLSRKRPVNIRLIEDDIEKLKADALREWIPYQTYISSVLHKYTNGIIK
jgi:predicted DNA binding CopG/RHH family protein